MLHDYDMIVIGGGAAGLTAAGMSALLGAKTMLVEADRLGGDCTWTGCIPSKTLLHAARMVHEASQAERLFARPEGHHTSRHVDFPRIMRAVHKIREGIYQDADAPPNLEKLGVEVVAGRAMFRSPHIVEITRQDGTIKRFSSRYYVIATGSRPHTGNFGVPVLTNESIFELSALPGRLAVIGAGPIGIELSQAFRRLGSEVTVIASGQGILPKDDPELTGMLRDSLQAEGIRFLFNRRATGAERCDDHLELQLDNGSRISCDAVLAAMGRQADVKSLRLENAGVRLGKSGVLIDQHCRTSASHIFASGDVTGKYQFTHMAEHMSKVAVTNAILRWPQSVDEAHVVWCTFTDPELAQLGRSEAELKKSGINYQSFRLPFSKIDRAVTDGDPSGVIKVFTSRRGPILGATIVGAHAGEMISEWSLAMRNGLTLGEIAATIHPYPTYMLGNRRTADQLYRHQLASPLLGLFGKVFGYRGTRRPPPVL